MGGLVPTGSRFPDTSGRHSSTMDSIDFEVAPRFVFLGNSIVSDWRNPLATTSRAVLRALGDLGFEAVYLEPRRNPATTGLLRQRGAQPVLRFNSARADLQYRTVDVPLQRETEVWIGQFAATAGVIVALDGTPEPVERGLHAFVSEDLQILVERPELGDDWGRSLVRRIDREEDSIGFRPAVLPRVWDGPRAGTVIVAYDDAALAAALAERVPDARRIVSGSADLPDWEFVAEIDLPPVYGAAERVLVIDAPDRPFAPARVWLPRANGALAWGVVEDEERVEALVTGAIAQVNAIWNQPQPGLPERLDARWVARGLVDLFQYRSVTEV